MIAVRVVITPELAVAAGKLAQKHSRQSVDIRYDDRRPEELWEVRFERLDGRPDDVYVVNDETGDVRGADL